MSKIVVSHAYGADENSVWFPYLRAQLQPLGHQVHVPRLPDTAAPRLKPWRSAFAEHAHAGPVPDTVLVGHSIGGVNILRFLEQHDVDAHGTFAGVVLVATPSHDVGYEELAEFFATPFDWARIRGTAKQFRVLVAADDHVLAPEPVAHVKNLVVGLGATAVVTATGGHLGGSPDDHIDLPEAVQLILDCLAHQQ